METVNFWVLSLRPICTRCLINRLSRDFLYVCLHSSAMTKNNSNLILWSAWGCKRQHRASKIDVKLTSTTLTTRTSTEPPANPLVPARTRPQRQKLTITKYKKTMRTTHTELITSRDSRSDAPCYSTKNTRRVGHRYFTPTTCKNDRSCKTIAFTINTFPSLSYIYFQ